MSSQGERNASRPRSLSRAEIQAIRARHPIEEVIAAYVELRPAGRRLVARCPLPGHEDASPSFSVYPEEQHFYCYGCNRGGDVFAFLQLVEGSSFREAVERLESNGSSITPRQVPAPPPARTPQSQSLDEASFKLLTAAAEVYHASLLLNPEMLAYLAGRGITLKTIKRFRLGYATGDNLAKYFRFRGWDLQLAKELGLVTARGEFFRERIILPEWRKGRAIYLTGRKTRKYQEVKYLGLPGMGKPLYGLEMSQGSAEVFIVEGAFDLLTLVQWGSPAVALLGSHLKNEWREDVAFAKRVFILTDSDEAGRAAAHRLAELFRERAVIVPPLPRAKDVNELALRPEGRMVFEELLARSDLERKRPQIDDATSFSNPVAR